MKIEKIELSSLVSTKFSVNFKTSRFMALNCSISVIGIKQILTQGKCKIFDPTFTASCDDSIGPFGPSLKW